MSATHRQGFTALAITVLVFGVSADAHASLSLRLTDSLTGDSVTITDGGAGDIVPGAGVIAYAGDVGAFTINVTTGSSKPVIGSPSHPKLGITSLNVTGLSASTLTIELTDTDFGPSSSPTGFKNTINSASANTQSISYSSYIDNTNAAFGMGTEITSLGSASGEFNLSGVGTVATGGSYSITMVLSLTQSAYGASQFDASLSALPEPASMLTWAGLAFIGLIGSKRNRSRL